MSEAIIRRTFAVIVDNEPGVLARVVGLFSGRGYNIESLTVTEVEADKHRSRITIVTNGTYQILEQIETLLRRLVPVHKVQDLTTDITTVERELAMVKVVGTGDDGLWHAEALVEEVRRQDAVLPRFLNDQDVVGRARDFNGLGPLRQRDLHPAE